MAKTVLVTGTSSGVGEATARLFATRGWNVAATARDPSVLGDWSSVSNVAALRLDVTDLDSIRRAVAETEQRFGPIDVLVNNAGGGLGGPVEGASLEQFNRLFNQNVFGVVSMIQAVLSTMRQRRQGVIVNVSSVSGRVGLPFLAPYCASKYALEGLTEAMTFELEPFGVRLKLIELGGVKTDFSHEWIQSSAFEPVSGLVQRRMDVGATKSPGPEGPAKTIYRAATDGAARLRYTANGAGMLLWMHRNLPTSAWRRLIRNALVPKDIKRAS
ncbi:MAG TPA: SDR family oxidoreductase [Caulobacteraceae bacterium]|nr:SDR family oxidoreductase [Caulobacteraceae bacterium]